MRDQKYLFYYNGHLQEITSNIVNNTGIMDILAGGLARRCGGQKGYDKSGNLLNVTPDAINALQITHLQTGALGALARRRGGRKYFRNRNLQHITTDAMNTPGIKHLFGPAASLVDAEDERIMTKAGTCSKLSQTL